METGGDALDASPSVAKLQTAETEGEKSHVCAAVEHAQAQLAPSASASLYTATQAASFSAPSDDRPPKVRKPYIMTKQRERWADEEHQAFLEGIKLYGRAWRKIEGHIGTKTAVQIRSHAQKYFSKLEKQGKLGEGDVVIPPPRPKRKPLRPYPKKAEPIAEAKAETISTAGLTAVTASGLTGPSAEAALSEQVSDPEGGADDKGAGASDALVAAVAAAASAAAAAAAACVVAAASDSVQAKLRENPPSGFPFFGMPPSLLPRGMVMAKGAHLKGALQVQPAAAAGAAAAAAAAPPAGPHAVGGLVSSTGTHRSRSSNGDSAMSNEPGTSQQAKSGRRAAKAPAAAQTSAGFPAAGASALPGRGVDPAVLLPGVPGSSYLSMLSALQAAPLQQAAGQGMLPAAVANAVAWQQLAEMQAGLAGLNATYPVLDGHADFASAGGLPGSQLYMQPKAVKRAAPSDLQGRQQKQAKAFKAPAREGADDGEVEGAHGKEASTPTPGYQEESAENPYLGRSAGTAQTAVKSQGGEGDNGHNSSGGDSNLVNGNGNGNRSGNGSGNGNSTGRTAQPPEAVAGERSTLVQDSERWDVGGQSQLQANRSGNGSRSRSRNASCTGNGSNGSGNKRGEDRGHAQANSGAAYEACLEQGGDDDSRLNNSVAAGEEAPKAPQSQDVVLAERRAALYLNSEMPCRGAFSAMKAVSTSQQPTSAAYQAAASNTGHPQHGPSRASVSHTDSHMKAVMAAMKGGTPRLQSLVGLPAAAAFPHSTMLPSGAALPVADGAAAVVAPAPFLWGPYAGLPGGGMAMAPGMAMVDAASLAGMLQAHTLAGSGSAVPGGAAAMPSGQGGSSNCTLGSSTAAMAGARCHRETESSMQGSLAQLVAALSQQVQDPGSWMAGGALGPASGGGALARPAKSLHGD